MLSKVMIERGHVDTRNRVMTLVCMNVTWGTTVQFVQVCARLVDRRAALVRRRCGCDRRCWCSQIVKYHAIPAAEGGGCRFAKVRAQTQPSPAALSLR